MGKHSLSCGKARVGWGVPGDCDKARAWGEVFSDCWISRRYWESRKSLEGRMGCRLGIASSLGLGKMGSSSLSQLVLPLAWQSGWEHREVC